MDNDTDMSKEIMISFGEPRDFDWTASKMKDSSNKEPDQSTHHATSQEASTPDSQTEAV